MDDDREARQAIDAVLDALQGQEVETWLRVGIAVSAAALGNMGENRDLMRVAFDRAISRETEWFAESARQKILAKKRLN
jgi:hypothetical protein